MIEDSELLRRYAAAHAEEDFAELVRRHVNLVYSAALRQVNGDAHLAQDATQLVFADLARKAASVAEHRVLAGWLFTSTRFAAAKLVRGERRRHARETEAQLMQELNRDPDAQLDWTRVRPVLDEVLGELGDADREAILLRFFEGRDFAGVGAKLNVTDNTARMRVERALDKLRAQLERRGMTSTTAALAAVLANQAVVAAPAGLAASVTGAALAGVGATAAGTAAAGGIAATFMSITKLQVGISGALALAGATGLVLQAQSNVQLRNEAASLRQDNAAIATLRAENQQLARTAAEVADMRGDDAELARLSDEAVALKGRMKQVAQAKAANAAKNSNVTGRATMDGQVYDITKLDQQPRPTFQARPQYPFELRRAGVTGTVVVDFVVDQNGDVQNARALKSTLAGDVMEKTDGSDNVVHLSSFTVGAEGPVSGNPAVDASNTTVNGIAVSQATQALGAAAVTAVSQWKFSAGKKSGQAVGAHMQVPIVFSVSQREGQPGAATPKN